MPRWLPKVARAEWNRIVRLLEPSGILSPVDMAVVCAYVSAWSDFRDASMKLATAGTTTPGSTGQLVEHPEVKRMERAEARMIAAAKLLGCTPATRLTAKIGQAESLDEDESEFFGVCG
jgi:P27 family predicted phage terminase small subunit